jgi:hypothetical protein
MWERRKPTPSRRQREAKIPKKSKNFGIDGLSQKETPKINMENLWLAATTFKKSVQQSLSFSHSYQSSHFWDFPPEK